LQNGSTFIDGINTIYGRGCGVVNQYYGGSSHDRLSNVFSVRHVLREKKNLSIQHGCHDYQVRMKANRYAAKVQIITIHCKAVVMIQRNIFVSNE
jgi:hypothetical protein